MIVYGWNTYLLKSVSPLELGLQNNNQSDTRIEYRQKYFHLFFIPFFPIGRFWAIRQNGQLYQASPELEKALYNVKPNWKHGLWAWSGPLLGIVIWILVSISSNMEERAYKKRAEQNKAMLAAFFNDKSKTAPLDQKLRTMNNLIDSSLSMVQYENKDIDTSMSKLLGLYLDARMTQTDSLTGYDQNNTFVITKFPGTDSRKEIIDKDYQSSLEAGDWKGYYGDTSTVFGELRKLEQYKYILVLKEYNRVEPQPEKDSYMSGYSLTKGRLLSIQTGEELASFKLMAGNSEKVSQFTYKGSNSYSGSSSSQLRSTLKYDLERNVLDEAYTYVFGKGLINNNRAY